MEKFFHPYHMMNMSPWPLLVGFGTLSVVVGMIKMFSFFEVDLLFISMMLMVVMSLLWWRDVVRASTFQGLHYSAVLSGLLVGMILFIVSKVFFFWLFFILDSDLLLSWDLYDPHVEFSLLILFSFLY